MNHDILKFKTNVLEMCSLMCKAYSATAAFPTERQVLLSGSFSIYLSVQILHKIYSPCVLYQAANQKA